MRLIDTRTLKLHQFISDSNIPPYAILSHTWGESETTLQYLSRELQSLQDDGPSKKLEGVIKVVSCCATALKDGWGYVWIDTCCIDKTSSSELSEAINSMFQWYRKAQVCYAYLYDAPSQSLGEDRVVTVESLYDLLQQSRWFARGWTLQELLAPEWVIFLAADWSELGTKASLSTVIEAITGITHLYNFEEASVAQKMSWAANRQTSRPEDVAYCLMGLFDVNMPLLYGEGTKAFTRLQLEILSKSDDESIFAWSNEDSPRKSPRPGLLADTPARFKDCSRIHRGLFDEHRPPHFMTNKGLRAELLLIPVDLPIGVSPVSSVTYRAPLNCYISDGSSDESSDGSSAKTSWVSLFLVECNGEFSRLGDPEELEDSFTSIDHRFRRSLIHIKQSGHNDMVTEASLPEQVIYTLRFDVADFLDRGYSVQGLIWPESADRFSFWHTGRGSDQAQFEVTASSKQAALLWFQHSLIFRSFTLVVWFSSKRPWIAATDGDIESLKDLASTFDENGWWPQEKTDPSTFQDRVQIDLDYPFFVDVALYRAGTLYFNAKSAKYRVAVLLKSRVRIEKVDGSVATKDSTSIDDATKQLDSKAGSPRSHEMEIRPDHLQDLPRIYDKTTMSLVSEETFKISW